MHTVVRSGEGRSEGRVKRRGSNLRPPGALRILGTEKRIGPGAARRGVAVSVWRSWLKALSRAGSQKLPVPEESARSWIILPKGIFIGRECMQKRGHRHKGAAPCGFSLDATSRGVDSKRRRIRSWPPRRGAAQRSALHGPPRLSRARYSRGRG